MNTATNDTKLKPLFEGIYKRELTSQEEFTIKTNLAGFFNTLIKIDKRKRKGGKS